MIIMTSSQKQFIFKIMLISLFVEIRVYIKLNGLTHQFVVGAELMFQSLLSVILPWQISSWECTLGKQSAMEGDAWVISFTEVMKQLLVGGAKLFGTDI